jgi:hypothetical protein
VAAEPEDPIMRAIPLAALIAAPLLAACTVNTAPAPTPVVVQERVPVQSQVAPPPVVLQRY